MTAENFKNTLKQRNELLLQFFGMKKSFKFWIVLLILILFYQIVIPTLVLWYILPVEKFITSKKRAISYMILFAFISLFLILPIIYATVDVVKSDNPPVKNNTKTEKVSKQDAVDKQKLQLLKSEEQTLNQVFSKIEFQQENKRGFGRYNFYIEPLTWAMLSADQKSNVFENCAAYTLLRTGAKNDTYTRFCVKIKDNSNNQTLAEYTHNGLELK